MSSAITILYYASINFLLYFTPIYLFFVKIWTENWHIKDWMDRASNRLFFSLTAIILTIFLLTGSIWYGMNFFVPIFYCFWFIIYLWKLPTWLGGYDTLLIATLCIFTISEVWETPIIANNLLVHTAFWNLQNLTLSGLKLLSIPVLWYMVRETKKSSLFTWKINRIFDTATLALFAFLAFYSMKGGVTFIEGILLRMFIALILYLYVSGYKKVTIK